MNRKKDRVQNYKPFHVELVNVKREGFELWFYSNIGNDYTRRNITKIHFDRWWLAYLASMLWKIINKDKERLSDDIKSLRGE